MFWTVKRTKKNSSGVYVLSHAKGLRPSTTLCLKIDGKLLKNTLKATDNLMHLNALAKYIKNKELQLPKLIDYAVRILGSSSDALCETIITWTNNGKEFKTRIRL
jgi:D-citramalate synthase